MLLFLSPTSPLIDATYSPCTFVVVLLTCSLGDASAEVNSSSLPGMCSLWGTFLIVDVLLSFQFYPRYAYRICSALESISSMSVRGALIRENFVLRIDREVHLWKDCRNIEEAVIFHLLVTKFAKAIGGLWTALWKEERTWDKKTFARLQLN
jgi:hypothetical protein